MLKFNFSATCNDFISYSRDNLRELVCSDMRVSFRQDIFMSAKLNKRFKYGFNISALGASGV
jgi:hypothetical protein